MTITIHRDLEQGSLMPLNKIDVSERAREVLAYCPDSGKFTWISPPWNHPRLLGMEAGGRKSGYTMIKIDGQKFKAHRLAWLFMTGRWPDQIIDHKDGDVFNNSWKNLRLCDHTLNNGNRKRNKGKRLPKGVRSLRNKFQARISFNGVAKSLGTYNSVEDAEAAYLSAAKTEFGEFARRA